ncbi:MAG TPA: hypothetical protein VKE70_23440, partial [Candidatus Solibacter sp.]|nr:hypothetical protein [Candidatus Solibacter sp.]
MSARRARSAPAPEARPARQWELPPGTFLFAAIAAFYVWTATSSQYAFVWGTKKADHYNLLAEGFLSGHLYLTQNPPKELLALPNPYDPVANAPYRLHDVSLYKGHYYVYFGPVPVLTLYLPWRILTGWSIPNNLAVIIFLLAGNVFLCMLLFRLLDASGVQLSWLQKRLAIAAISLCQTAPLILRRAFMYETAVAAGMCFAAAGFYFLARYVTSAQPRPWQAIAAGLCLGLTPGCRPNYLVVVAVASAAYLLYLLRARGLRGRDLRHELYLFGAPIVACGLLLCWYNFARFGNPFNVGQAYQLVGTTADRGISFNWSTLLPGLYRLLLERPVWVGHFPFVELSTAGNFGAEQWPAGADHREAMSGLLLLCPLSIAGFLLPVWLRRWKLSTSVLFTLTSLYVAAVFNMTGIVMTVNNVTQRYEIDFAPPFLVLSLFALFAFAAKIEHKHYRIAAQAGIAAAIVASAAIQAAASIQSYANTLAEMNLPAFTELAHFFGDDDANMRRGVYGLKLDGQIVFRDQPAGTREALLTSGVPRRSNAIFIEYLSGNRIKFASFWSGGGRADGPEIQITPGKPYELGLLFLPSNHDL